MFKNALTKKIRNFVWLFSLFIASNACATDFYISSSTGSNLNIGTQALPLKNVSMWTSPPSPIAGNKLQPGDHVFFKRGDEWVSQDAQWDITSSGVAGNPITFDAYGTGANPLFTGARSAASIGNGANTWTQYSSNPNIWYNIGGSVNWYCKVVIEDGTKPLWRAGSVAPGSTSNLSEMKPGTFYSDGSKLFVWTTDGARPDAHTLYIGMHPTDDAFRGLVKVGKDGGSSYIIFKNLDARMSNSQGFTSSGEHQEFWNCNSSFNARDGFYFIKYFVSAPGGQYNMAYNCTATNNVISGGGGGQGITIETPYTWLYNCTSSNNGMAGIDFLDWNVSTDVHHSGAYNCTTLNNGRSATTNDNYDPGIYIDGGRDILLYNCIVGDNGSGTDKVKLYPDPGISIDVEPLGFSNGKRPNNIAIVNCLSYNNRGEGLRIGDINGGQSSILAVSNVKTVNSAFQRAISNANSDAATSGLGYFTRTIKFHGSNITFKNNAVHTTVSSRSSLFLDDTVTESGLNSDANIFFNSGSSNVSEIYAVGAFSLAQWQTRGHDKASALSDPNVSPDPTTFINTRLSQIPPADPNNPPTLDTFLNLLAQYNSGSTVIPPPPTPSPSPSPSPSPVPDTTAPSIPANLTASVSGTQVNLSWGASTDNVGVTGYQVLNGSTLLGTTASTSYTVNGTAGTSYSFTVTAYDAANNISGASSAAAVTIPATTLGLLPPTNVVASFSNGSVTVTWGPSPSTGVVGYNIYRNNTYVTTKGTMSYTDSSVTAGSTYTYAIQVYDAANNKSALSAPATITIPSATPSPSPTPDTTAPSIPANLTASVSGTQVNLSWNASTDNVGVIGYQILNGSTLLGTTASITYTVTNLSAGTTYNFTVKAFDAANNLSGSSNVATVTIPAAPAPVPSPSPSPAPTPSGLIAPSNVVATFSNGSVTVTWDPSSSPTALAFNIYRNNIYVTTKGTRSYTDSTVTAGSIYSYAIQVYDAANNLSPLSTPATITIPSISPSPTPSPIPTTPQNLSATVSNGTVILLWGASTDDIAVLGYNIYKNNSYVISIAGTSYTDTAVIAGNIYSYTVQAYDGSNNKSSLSNPVTVTIPSVASSPNGPTTPTNLTVTLFSNNKARLSWGASTSGNFGIRGYNIYRDGSYLTTVGTTNCNDGPLTPGKSYVYAVQSFDGSNNKSALSNAVTVAVPQIVTILSYSVSSLTSTTAILTWQTNVLTTGYIKYGLSTSSLTSTSYMTSSGTTGSVILSALSAGKTYYYQIVAADSTGKIALSPVDTFTTTTS